VGDQRDERDEEAVDQGGERLARFICVALPEDQQYLPSNDPDFDVVYALRPQSAMAWRLDDYPASQLRWSS
jgi:hypothetical protein